MYRLQGGDASSDSETHVVTDVPAVFDVFNEMSFELSKVNLKGLAGKGLGVRMVGTVQADPGLKAFRFQSLIVKRITTLST